MAVHGATWWYCSCFNSWLVLPGTSISLTDLVNIYTLGKPGLERHFHHPASCAVVKLQFITNRVRLM
jgi:hypothetical protein